MKGKVALHNLGCKVNAYETEAMQQMLEAAGYDSFRCFYPFVQLSSAASGGGKWLYYRLPDSGKSN